MRTWANHDPLLSGADQRRIRKRPRFLLKVVPPLKMREADLHENRSMCCGAGGGRMWLEEDLGTRINQLRFSQLKESGTNDVAVACPYCFSMLSDAQNETGHEEAKTWDVIELVARGLSS